MRLAFFLAAYPVTSETFVLRQIRGMISLGHDVTIITGVHDKSIPDPFAGAAPIRVIRSRHRNKGSLLKQAMDVLSLIGSAKSAEGRTRIRAAKAALNGRLVAPLMDISGSARMPLGHYDIIIAHFGPAGVRAMYLRDAGLISGQIATVFHGLDVTETALVRRFLPHYKRLFQKTEALLPISDLWKQRLISWGAAVEKISVHRMGVDVADFTFVENRSLNRPLKIMTTARFVQKKGLTYAIQAICNVYEDVHFTIVGYGPLEKELRASALACPGRISFAGKMGHKEVLSALRDSDVFLLPSVIADNGDMEGIPVSLMEAMALGVITISTWHSGIPELIRDGIEGFLVHERNPDEIAAMISHIVNSNKNLSEIRKAARAKVELEFDNEKLDYRLQSLLQLKIKQV
jgi:colanic acid/amylovoran biosynthesis glycosyltransferase